MANKISIGLLAVTFLVFIGFVAATPSENLENRFFIKSTNPALKAFFGVNHEFQNGFTATLNKHQLNVLGALGVETESVPLRHITAPPGACSPWPECKDDGGDPEPTTRTCEPSDQTPYGIEMVYDDSTITSTSGGLNVDVAVLDTGVLKDHLDLKNRVEQCKDFTKGPKVKNTCNDGHGHGTHVSGTVLADSGSDRKGIFGVAPEADLFAYKVCGDNGVCWSDDVASAIRHAADQGAEIISMSLGGSTPSSLEKDAIDYAVSQGVLVIAAAGNSGPDLNTIEYPGAFDNVVAVAAIDSNKVVASFSSRGINDGDSTIEEREVELSGPGVSVLSTLNNGCYTTASGTSMATPHISGLAAKLWQGSNTLTRTHLQSITQDITQGLHAGIGDDPASGLGLPTA